MSLLSLDGAFVILAKALVAAALAASVAALGTVPDFSPVTVAEAVGDLPSVLAGLPSVEPADFFSSVL